MSTSLRVKRRFEGCSVRCRPEMERLAATEECGASVGVGLPATDCLVDRRGRCRWRCPAYFQPTERVNDPIEVEAPAQPIYLRREHFGVVRAPVGGLHSRHRRAAGVIGDAGEGSVALHEGLSLAHV
jgi:hypothetical protein